nr:immunoglobulin heavy chain junction region [Mus musculus]
LLCKRGLLQVCL